MADHADDDAELAAARAQQARAHATELRKLADELGRDTSALGSGGGSIENGDVIRHGATDGDVVEPDPHPLRSTPRRRRLRRPGRRAAAIAAGLLLVCASLGASGYIWHQHRTLAEERQRATVYAAVARTDLTNLVSIDFTKARDDVQHVIDNSTGRFKDEFQAGADDLVAALEQSKVTTTVTVKAVAVTSMTKESATVLVAATAVASSLGSVPRPPETSASSSL